MTEEEFRAAVADYKAKHEGGSLEHAAKGSSWKKHKYIRIENGRYIYPDETGKKLNDKLTKDESGYLAVDRKLVRDHLNSAVSKKSEKINDDNSWDKDTEIDNAIEKAKRDEAEKAAKEVVSEVASDFTRSFKYYLKGMNPDFNFDEIGPAIEHHLKAKKIDPEKFLHETNDLGYRMEDEIISILIREMKKILNGDTSEYDPKIVAQLKKELAEEGGTVDEDWKTKRPFANREKEIESAVKVNKIRTVRHSYDDPKSFYAAVYDYKQAHKR